MATIVIVHGGWAGAWMYKDLARELQAKGHEVYRPSLTGVGERSHLMRADITLDTHIMDVVNVLEYEELTDVILAGHSSGGFVISGVAARVGHRIRKLVYMDALVPKDGQAIALEHTPPEMLIRFLKAGADTPWLMQFAGSQPQAKPRPGGTVIDYKKIGPMPLLTAIQAVKLGGTEHLVKERTFIHADGGAYSPFTALAEELRRDPAWKVRTIHTGHTIVDEDYVGLARMLDEEAQPA